MRRESILLNETPLPSGYTRQNYIEGVGAQSIGTGYYVGNKKTRIVCDMMKTGTFDNGVFFGCASNSDNQWFCNPYFQSSNNPSGNMMVYMLGLGWSLATYHQFNEHFNLDFTIDIPNQTFDGWYTNGQSSASGHKVGFGTIANAELHIFSSYRGYLQNYIHARLYSFKIYENDVLIHDYVPALRDYDTKPGLYDVVANEFKVNKGSGEFIYA